jgi:hypothetical protein
MSNFFFGNGKHIQRGEPLGNVQRMAIGEENRGVTQSPCLGALRGGGQHQVASAGMGVLAHAAVLDEPGGTKPTGFGGSEFFEGFLKYPLLVAPSEVRHRHFVKKIEKHTG